jgi:hypothetical protein
VSSNKKARVKREPSFSKTPKASVTVASGKMPRVAEEPHSIMDARPSWRLSNLRMKAPFGWDAIDRDDMKQVIAHFKSLESMTWSDILVASRKHNHHCDVARMSRNAQACIEEDWQGGVDDVLTIRLTNKKRVWGILEGAIVYLLWWDPEHDVYPSLKKNT